jgi:3-deoxy-7-phosphoheptulonate synthase
MSPEIQTSTTTAFFDESEQLKNKLLKIEEKRHIAADVATEDDLNELQDQQGINPNELASPELLKQLIDTRIEDQKTRISAELIARELPLTTRMALTTLKARTNVENILLGKDDRIFVIVGPCSIHDPLAAIEYAEHVKQWREEFGDDIEIVMRFYTEKPRTELKEDPLASWKGLAYDPRIDRSNDINLGMIAARRLARHITEMEVPLAAERLDPVTPQYMDGLITYDAIGARDTTSQNARHYGSGTSSVLGFKNTPDGNIDAAIEAAASAQVKSTFSGSHKKGSPSELWTKGNPTSHIILRGYQDNGDYKPNYTPDIVAITKEKMRAKGLEEAIVIDASHGNSSKKAGKQVEVVQNVANQIILGETAIKGVMIESNLVAGKQDILKVWNEGKELVYGQSITDECSGLKETRQMLALLAGAVKARRSIIVVGAR